MKKVTYNTLRRSGIRSINIRFSSEHAFFKALVENKYYLYAVPTIFILLIGVIAKLSTVI
jgi:hypothetical protein